MATNYEQGTTGMGTGTHTGTMGTGTHTGTGTRGTTGGYGKVVLTIKSAHNLRDKSWIGKADPYCQIKVADAEIQTHVVKNAGESCSWEESFAFNNVAPEDVMYFYVYDKNLMKDALIGEGSLSLRAAFEDQTLDTRVPLTNRAGTKDAGEIWVTLRMEGGAGGRTERREETMGMGTTTRTSEMETERMAAMPATHTTRRATEGVVEGERGAVCGQEYFTKTEDRPVVIERVERILEHRPVEKEFVVETRATGVEKMHAGAVESQGVTEKIVHETRPGAPCAGEP